MIANKIKGIFSLLIGSSITALLVLSYQWLVSEYELDFGEFILTILVVIVCLPMFYGVSMCHKEFSKEDKELKNKK